MAGLGLCKVVPQLPDPSTGPNVLPKFGVQNRFLSGFGPRRAGQKTPPVGQAPKKAPNQADETLHPGGQGLSPENVVAIRSLRQEPLPLQLLQDPQQMPVAGFHQIRAEG